MIHVSHVTSDMISHEESSVSSDRCQVSVSGEVRAVLAARLAPEYTLYNRARARLATQHAACTASGGFNNMNE